MPDSVQKLDSTQTQDWPWPDSLDALTAAPRHLTLLFENERIRVLNTSIPAGERTAVQTHCWPSALYILSWGDFVRAVELKENPG
jgi:hypothetical protein